MQYKQYRTLVFLALLLSLTLLASSSARAQRGGGRFVAPSSGAMRRAPVGVGSAATSHRTRNFESFSGFPSVGNFGFLGAGGSGQDLATQAAINPATQLRLAFAEKFLRNNRRFLGGGGYYLLDGGGAYVIPAEPAAESDAPQEQQPPVVLVQQAPPQLAAAAEAQPPLPDEGEFSLVLHDGKEIQASAFSQMKGNIVYIAPDGTRHTISISDLDAGATERVNEERGTPVQLHL